MANLDRPLERPTGIKDASWADLQRLDTTDHTAALAIADRLPAAVSAGRDPDAYVADALTNRYRGLTAAGASPSAAQFFSVLPPAARALIDRADRIDPTNGDARGSFVADIGNYVS